MMKSVSKANDHQVDFIQQRVKFVEKHLSEICANFAAYTRKTGQLRDSGDALANKILNYAVGENLHRSLRINLTKFAENLAAVQDYRQAEIQRLETKVVLELAEFGDVCKQAKEDIKNSFSARAQELTWKQELEKARGQQHINWQHISQAESELYKATNEATKSYKELEDKMDTFEKKKIDDLKKIFTHFINIELLFHAKALEIYTKAYNDIAKIDTVADLEEFRNCLRTPSLLSRSDILKESGFETQHPKNPLPSALPQTVVKRKTFSSSEIQIRASPTFSQEQNSDKTSSDDEAKDDKH